MFDHRLSTFTFLLVKFTQSRIEIYPDESCKPSVGNDLNKNAEITLFHVQPKKHLPSESDKCLAVKQLFPNYKSTDSLQFQIVKSIIELHIVISDPVLLLQNHGCFRYIRYASVDSRISTII